MAIQIVIVSKRVAKSRAEAEGLVRRATGHEPYTIRETESGWRFRQLSSEKCKPGSFKTLDTKIDGVSIVTCELV